MREQRFDRVIYVVNGRAPVNDRVNKILGLEIPWSRLILVTPEPDPAARDSLVVKAFPNPTNMFRVANLWRMQQTLDRLLFFPSRKILYVKPVERALRRRIRTDIQQDKKVVLLTCVPPHDVALVGLLLKRQLPKIRWIVDWQDLWSYDENYFGRVPRWRRGRLLKLERRMMATIDMNIATNDYAKDVLEKHYNIPRGRVTSIPHHYSPSDLPCAALEQKCAQIAQYGKPIKIGFLGTFYKPPRVPGDVVSRAIGELRDSGLDVELHVHGGMPRANNRLLDKMRRDGVVFHGRATHKDSVSALTRYDFLMLLLADLANSRAVMSIKLPHYLLVRRPILAIVPDPSAVANIVRETASGYVIDINGGWREQLKDIVSESVRGHLPPEPNLDAVEQYAWNNISKRWLEILAH